MNILVDQCVHQDVIVTLRKNGLSVQKVEEANIKFPSDEAIFLYACHTGRLLFTYDKDFGNIALFPIRNSHGVSILYTEGMDKVVILERSLYFFQQFLKDQNPKGRLFIIESKKIRVWPK